MSSETCVWQGILESNWNKTHQSNLLYYLLFPDFFPDDAEKSLKNLGSDKMPRLERTVKHVGYNNNTNRCNVYFVYIFFFFVCTGSS